MEFVSENMTIFVVNHNLGLKDIIAIIKNQIIFIVHGSLPSFHKPQRHGTSKHIVVYLEVAII